MTREQLTGIWMRLRQATIEIGELREAILGCWDEMDGRARKLCNDALAQSNKRLLSLMDEYKIAARQFFGY